MTISLILPYWDRQEAANKALELLAETYKGIMLEVIVVDDGNKIPFVKPDLNLDIKVVRLPQKDKPTPQSKAWNAGVKFARGEVICLSCVEVLHTEPVLIEMLRRLRKEGGYVLAAAWCPDENKWHCHSTAKVDYCPEGTGAAFCGMMYRDTFNLVGGFDEDYHEGAGYEDKDFIKRLCQAGVKFTICDDLVVTHPKAGAKIVWESAGFRKNRELFLKKWGSGESITFVCLKAGQAYGPEYVNILLDMVSRNLTYGQKGRFCCITDDPSGLDERVEVIPLPSDLETWWGKLYMFKRGVFSENERIIFMDLDTLIISPIDDLIKYQGQFATLRDFYHPQQVGPAVIMWKAGDFTYSIWDEWVAQGKPRNPMGDLWWINNLDQGRFVKEIDILQDVFPGKFVSFKADCNPYPPKGASVVCFHGQPKPDNCVTDWVSGTWKIGGGGFAEIEAEANTAKYQTDINVLSACKRHLPWLEWANPHEEQIVIVCGGPSLKDTMPEIHYRKTLGQKIMAINGTAKFLNQHGIEPDIHLIIDARPMNAKFIRESISKSYYLASQVDPDVFEAASEKAVQESSSVHLFHMNTEGISELLPKDREIQLISSGSTAGLAGLAVAYTLGFRALHLHGFDSSYGDSHHAYEQKQNDEDVVIDVSVNGQSFKSTGWMVKQVQEFQNLATQLAEAGTVLTVAGSGLLPYVAKLMGS